jgi:hypothetical protein
MLVYHEVWMERLILAEDLNCRLKTNLKPQIIKYLKYEFGRFLNGTSLIIQRIMEEFRLYGGVMIWCPEFC